jgi:hypothetical protein
MSAMLADLASVATAVGVLAAAMGLLLSRRQTRASFEQEFVKRYWLIGDDALQQDTTYGGDILRQRYLRLCEDEFEVMRLGSISWRTWEVWHDALREEATQYSYDSSDVHEWLSTCLHANDHRGSDCPGIFRSGSAVYSRHLSARWRSSIGRKWFIAVSALRRALYGRGHS